LVLHGDTFAWILAAGGRQSFTRTRDVYLSLASFHAYLELAALGMLSVRGS
jgi:hypothetical protein